MEKTVTLDLPDWLSSGEFRDPAPVPDDRARMALIIRLSRMNFQRGTGGPFAAGVFEKDSGRIVSLGVNRVMPANCSSAHAEVMALSLAQKALGNWDLGNNGQRILQLVVNWRPCAMCFGALLWSGARELLIAGHGPELEEITGFDEGPLPDNWREELEKRGIRVTSGMLRKEALEVFTAFRDSGAVVYNPGAGISRDSAGKRDAGNR
jgi:tRNA(Arg) A34 adenosine deaminase TadA